MLIAGVELTSRSDLEKLVGAGELAKAFIEYILLNFDVAGLQDLSVNDSCRMVSLNSCQGQHHHYHF